MKHTFSEILDTLFNGGIVRRSAWTEADRFVFQQIPSEVPFAIISKMTSLPQSMKEFFDRRGEPIRYRDQWAVVDRDNVIRSYSPSVEDIHATDWEIWDSGVVLSKEQREAYTRALETVGTAKPI